MNKKKPFQDIYSQEEYDEPGIELHPEAKAPEISSLEKQILEKRTSPRFVLELEVVIFYSGQSFRSKTLNVSTSGVLLADLLPGDFVNQALDIVMMRNIGSNRDYFLIKGKSEGGPFRTPRISFTLIPEIQKKRLEAIFETCEPWKT